MAVTLRLTCEECGVISTLECDDSLDAHEEANDVIEQHWKDAHPYPHVRFDWLGE